MSDVILFLPEITILGGALLAFMVSVVGGSYRTAWGVSILAAAAAVVVTISGLHHSGEPFFRGIYRVDLFSQLLKLGIGVGLLLTLLASEDLASTRRRARLDTPIFLFMSAAGMMMLVSATELITFYVALELSAYGLYIMAALHRSQREGSEAGAKYVLFGAASSAITLYGISLIFGAAQSTYVAQIAAAGPSPLLIIGILLALSGLFFKLALFPFHAWAPDTYQGAPHQAATFIGTASKVAAVGALIRVLYMIGPDNQAVITVLIALSVASMTFGNLAAIVQKDFKRLLAYSTIAHAGYILIGVLTFSQTGAASAIFYVLIYVPIAFCTFLVVCTTGGDGRNPGVKDLAGLYKRSPLIGLVLLVGMFGLAGIPPTPGFAGKWFLFSAAIEKGMFWLVLVAAINATISLYYYLGAIKEAYLTPPGDLPPLHLGFSYKVAAYVAVALTLVAGFYPRPLWELAENAARVIGG